MMETFNLHAHPLVQIATGRYCCAAVRHPLGLSSLCDVLLGVCVIGKAAEMVCCSATYDQTAMAVLLSLLLIMILGVNDSIASQPDLLDEGQPRILTHNGHVIIVGGENRNITFRTTGRGYVNLNNDNLMQVALLAKNASETVERIHRNVLSTFEQSLNGLTETVNGRRGLAQKVSTIERQLANGTAGGGGRGGTRGVVGLRTRVVALTRRVGTLERQVKDLQNLLVSNECASNPCHNGATCEDHFNGFFCRCPPNWQGTLCDADVNECANFMGTDLGCQNGATCINKPGTYECVCAVGWFGIHCTQRSNDCSQSSAQELCGHGVCVDQKGTVGHTCICDQGWTKDAGGACTQDVDECTQSTPACSRDPPVQCINAPGSFYCASCPQGYTGNGFSCSDVNECLVNNGGCSMNPMVQCINTHGSRVCGQCPPGFQGDGTSCSYSGHACHINNGGCHPLAHCQDNPQLGASYVVCQCPLGYVGTGVGPSGCVASAAVSSACQSNPCVHGSCVSRGGGFACVCPQGYSGPTCATTVNPCDSAPCMNGGTCSVSEGGRFICDCPSTHTGPQCQQEQRACGGRLNSPSGSLKFPASTSSGSQTYPINHVCAWLIVTNSTLVLNITFKSFHLESSPHCQFDWLQIYDGPTPSDLSMGRFCGITLPKGGNFVSTHNSLYLWFRSDHSVSGGGFELHWNSTPPVCGGVVNFESHGTLSSPGAPGRYPPNRDCNWLLQAPFGKRIQINFYSMMIETHQNCSYDYLEVRSGHSPTGPLLQQYCNSSHPPPLLTPGSDALLHFHSDSSGSDLGFTLTYTAVPGITGCGGILTEPLGYIASPNHADQYRESMDCEWKIQMPFGQRIRLTFLSFDLEQSTSCRFDYVEVLDGGSLTSPSKGRYCGTNLPPRMMSSENSLIVHFVTDWSIARAGFRIKFEAVCGGTFNAPTGVITSPMYPNQYPSAALCIYEIVQPTGRAISLQFHIFDVEDGEDCEYDSLEIRDGDNENSTLVGRYCSENNEQIPPPVISSFNYLWIKFQADTSLSYSGFYANYTSYDIGCGGIMKEEQGTIQTPRHAESYPASQQCLWVISAPPGHVVQLTFLTFSLEGESHGRCSYDYVKVFDNSSIPGSGGLINRFCGSELPPLLTTSDNMMTVLFQSDSSVSLEGFTARYNVIDASRMCGGRFYTSTGVIKSPNFPDNYPVGKQCTWVIQVPHGQQIMLNVTDFSLENHSSCRYDYLEIRNGGFDTSPLIGKYCGTSLVGRRIPSHSNQMFLRFVTDNSQSEKGFRIEWDGSATGCGGTLSSPSGFITSPNYPQPYGRNAACFWRISVSKGSAVQIVFVDLDLEQHRNCLMDYVEVRDGFDSSAKMVGRYCSDNRPAHIKSTGNHLFLKFRSDISEQGRGFSIAFDTVCNNEVSGFRGVIESPNFPQPYPHNRDCTWTISVPRGNKINITFSHLDLEDSIHMHESVEPCRFDYVEVREQDVGQPSSRPLGRFCGAELPAPIASSVNKVTVHFVADQYVAYRGFRLEWILNGCGGLMTKPSGEFTSPGYPNETPLSTSCEWTISVDWDRSIELTIEDFSFELASSCAFDSLNIYGGPDDTAPQLAQLCITQTKPTVYTSTGNNMFLRLVSDASYVSKGFKASYRSVPSRCGGLMTAPVGQIHSRNYPSNYDHNDDCMWLIEVDPLHVVRLTFRTFDVEAHNNCTADFVDVYDGNSTSAPRLLRHCGNTLPTPSVLTSTGPYMLVRMKVDSSVSAKGFLANYSLACGAKIITEDSGVISMHSSLNVNEDNANCTWVIAGADFSDRVSLTINHISVSPSEESISGSCEHYFVEVIDGDDINGTSLGQYCGTRAPPRLTSRGNVLTMRLVSLYGMHYGEFSATYSVLSSACGGNLTSEEGYFTSPDYPDNYPINTECVWTLDTSPGNRVGLTFVTFNLKWSENCDEDFVEVRKDGPLGELLGVHCGVELPTNLTVGHRLWVKFRSTGEGTGPGFMAAYTMQHGNELSGQSGQIASPLYPRPYIQVAEYHWRITVDFRKVVSFVFQDFYMSFFVDQCYHFLALHDGYDETAPLLWQGCGGRIPDPVTSSSNVAFVHFSSSYQRAYFLLNWTQVEPQEAELSVEPTSSPGCGDIVHLGPTNTTHQWTSPGYPYGYANSLRCEWVFSTPPTHHLSLGFLAMNLEASPSCYMDYVEVWHGRNGLPEWELAKQFCLPNETNAPMLQGSSLMRVIFISDFSHNLTGFSAIIYAECGGSLTGPNGVIVVDNTTANYYANMGMKRITTCEWNITVRAGRTVVVEFDSFSVPSVDSSCSNAYVLLRNGGTAESPILSHGKYCGSNRPVVNATTGNQLYVKYTATHHRGNFKMRYREQSYSCGGRITLSEMDNFTDIHSPNYPNIPPAHIECVWVIMAPGGEKLSIDFHDRFDITNSPNCEVAYLEVQDGGTQQSFSLGRFCDNTAPSTMTTTGNVMLVKFFTDAPEPNNGFKARVSIASCGGIVRAAQGSVASPSYPGVYPSKANCSWRIVGPMDHYLVVAFSDLNLPSSRTCTRDRVILTTTEVDTESTLGTYCGSTLPSSLQTPSNELTVTFISGDSGSRYLTYRGFKLNFNSSQEECGGSLDQPSGTISSPGYPNRYTQKRFCRWEITVPRGRRVTLQVMDLDLAGSGDTYDQRVSAFNDFNYASHIGSFSYQDAPTTLHSTDNRMLVYFWSRQNVGHRGFSATFSSDLPSVCLGSLDEATGVLTPPDAALNLTRFSCEWQRTVQLTNQTLTITLQPGTVGFQSTFHCKYTSGVVVSAATSTATGNLAEWCHNNTVPLSVRSPLPGTRIKAVKGNRHVANVNFTIQYKISQCGGLLSGPEEIVVSPGYPSNYPADTDCAWSVTFPEGQRIKLHVNDLDIEAPCTKDFLTVHNGPLPTSPVIQTLCGNTRPADITSQSNSLWIEFHSDSAKSGRGFNISLEPVFGGCGGIIHENNKEIATPNFPQSYPDNSECLWDISVESGYFIQIVFVEQFGIQSSSDCGKDFVEVFDYVGQEVQSLGRLCGRMPLQFHSTGNRMRVLFRSDETVNSVGFKARWTVNCGAVIINQTRGTIVSPGYPVAYGNNLVCNYTILAPDQFISVQFDSFKLESGYQGCKYDNVTLYAPRYHWWHEVEERGVYCGKEGPPPIRAFGRIEIVLRTDPYIQYPGFLLRYDVERCGGNVTKEGILMSPGNMMSGRESNCTWVINAPPNKVVLLRFSTLILEYHEHCVFDWISVYDAPFTNSSHSLGKVCGDLSKNLPSFHSTGPNMTVEYITDSSVDGEGFQAVVLFTTKCGGRLQLNGTYSLRYPSSGRYEAFQSCHWEVFAPVGSSIQFRFTRVDIAPCFNTTETAKCSCDYVELRDGANQFADVMGRHCGTTTPGLLTTSSNTLWISFTADVVSDGTGFQLELTVVPPPCGSPHLVATDQPQVLTSPNYQTLTQHALRCRWILQGSKRLHLRMSDVDLDGDCLQFYDSAPVTLISESLGQNFVYSGPSRSRNSYHARENMVAPTVSLCKKVNQSLDFYSNSHQLTVLYTSSATSEGKGFMLEYSHAGCSRNYTGEQGRIFMKRQQGDCSVIVQAQPNHTISLYFKALHRFGSEGCRDDALEVYDGPTQSAPHLATLCGFEVPDPIFSSSSSVLLHFRSRTGRYYDLTDITYTTTDQGRGCGGSLFNYGGVFTSSGYPQNVRNASRCRWDVTVPDSLQVALYFSVFDLGPRVTCDTDFVELLDIDPETSVETMRTRYCGGDTPADFVGISNKMALRYTTSVHNGGTGWVAQFVGQPQGGEAPNRYRQNYYDYYD